MTRLLLVSLGGALGTATRYLVGGLALKLFGPVFPFGTLTVNLLGSFLVGLVVQLGLSELVSPTTRIVLTAGFMGGFTTYSAFAVETTVLLREGAALLAAANVGVTLVGGLVACFLGMSLGRALGI